MTILVTGAKGMIGSKLVKGLLDAGHVVIGIDRTGDETSGGSYYHYKCDLSDRERLQKIADSNKVDRFIHLAALAHTTNGKRYTWELYKTINVDCAKNLFEVAGERPVLFISTVDVFGFYDGTRPVNGETPIHPVTYYGKSKAMAEEECKKLSHFDIYRFSPVYTETIKRDIQKRYYLKYPQIAYQIGSGNYYEILNIKIAVSNMVDWCNNNPSNKIRIVKDPDRMFTPEYIRSEKEAGRAKIVIYVPKGFAKVCYKAIKITGNNKYAFLLNKAVYPLITE